MAIEILSPSTRRHDRLVPHGFYEKTDIAKVNMLEGCFLELSKVFEE